MAAAAAAAVCIQAYAFPRPHAPVLRASSPPSLPLHPLPLAVLPELRAIACPPARIPRRLLPLSAQRPPTQHHNPPCCTDSSDDDGDDDGARAAFLARKSTFERIQSCGVIACLRSAHEEVALHAGRAALDGGVSVLEVTMTTSGAFQVIKKLVREYPSATIGAGTILTWQDAERAKEAGATFLTSPVTDKELVQAHSSSNVLFIPGAMTPSEILQARRWGASCVKLYPVSMMGGVQYVEMLKKLFPNIPIIASNGIFLETVKSYLQVGSTAVILSDAVFNKTSLAQHDYAQILQLSKMVAALITSSDVVGTGTLKYTRLKISTSELSTKRIT